jgi:hypothetical protein
MWKTVNAD